MVRSTFPETSFSRNRLTFPDDFAWGVAAAAPQIEGAAHTDDKGLSVWDTFARRSGTVRNGDILEPACNHYYNYDEDFALMARLGIKNYRLSFAWPRILPDGTRASLNPKGLDYYHRLLDSMHKHGITPWPTLFHWDLPQALEDAGGWRARSITDAFALYADTVVTAFAGQVKHWFTINETPCFTVLPHTGALDKAPGYPLPMRDIYQNIHHALMAHGHGVRAVREHGGKDAQVGIAEVPEGVVPISETPEDIEAAHLAWHASNDGILGAVLTGGYSESHLRRMGADRPTILPGDFDLISRPADYVGLNCYHARFVRATDDDDGFEFLPFPKGYPQTTPTGWLKTVPQSIYWTTRLTAERYGAQAIYITENGYGAEDECAKHGEVIDLHRRDYMRQHLLELRRAIGDGVPVKGYFAWSFMDNFEWADGYNTRFGLCHTDYLTQKRTPKLSGNWYAKVIHDNAVL